MLLSYMREKYTFISSANISRSYSRFPLMSNFSGKSFCFSFSLITSFDCFPCFSGVTLIFLKAMSVIIFFSFLNQNFQMFIETFQLIIGFSSFFSILWNFSQFGIILFIPSNQKPINMLIGFWSNSSLDLVSALCSCS